LSTVYAAGLRVGEVVRLKVTSIDSQRITPHRSWQGRPRPIRDALATTFGYSSGLLEAGTAPLMVVSGPGAGRSCQHRRSPGRMSRRKEARSHQQTRDHPFPEALCLLPDYVWYSEWPTDFIGNIGSSRSRVLPITQHSFARLRESNCQVS
jgi:hypothetical protein